MTEELATGTRVRFTEDYLARSSEAFARRYRGRVGQVTGYRLGAIYPIVLFPKDGRRPEQKLFEVSTRALEICGDSAAPGEA